MDFPFLQHFMSPSWLPTEVHNRWICTAIWKGNEASTKKRGCLTQAESAAPSLRVSRHADTCESQATSSCTQFLVTLSLDWAGLVLVNWAPLPRLQVALMGGLETRIILLCPLLLWLFPFDRKFHLVKEKQRKGNSYKILLRANQSKQVCSLSLHFNKANFSNHILCSKF